MSIPPIAFDQSTITQAVENLRNGELVAFPTETVYGLGADASNEKAIQKLYATKGRPGNHPVIVHLASFEQINDWAEELPPYAILLAKHFWPGPLTLIVKKAKHVSNFITGGQDTVGIRVPAHPLALALLQAFGGGLVAPSANKYGRISATSAEHVKQEFGDELSMIIDGGNCPVGIESTIIDVTGAGLRILRPGAISEQDIAEVMESSLSIHSIDFQSKLVSDGKPIRVPGSDKNHYAPMTPMLLLEKAALDEMLKKSTIDGSANSELRYGVLGFSEPAGVVAKFMQASSDSQLYARELYSNLRQLDKCGMDYILTEAPPQAPEWVAISDRLSRAATKL